MLRLAVAAFALASAIGYALAESTPAPIIEISAGAKIYGPVTIRNALGDIVLVVPKDSYVFTFGAEGTAH
jgi:hypothetical protein